MTMSSLIVTVQVRVTGGQAPPVQPVKEESFDGVAVRVMTVPIGTDCVQVVPQENVSAVTVPVPVPSLAMERVGRLGVVGVVGGGVVGGTYGREGFAVGVYVNVA